VPLPPIARIAAAIIVLAILGFTLPIRVRNTAAAPLIEHCMQLADSATAPNHDSLIELERCSAVVPDDVELLADLGNAYEAAGRQREAEAVYRKVLASDPDYADVHVRLATLILAQGGAAAEAREHAEQALRVQPNRRTVQALLDTIERSRTP
jgi:tetratricopeptide (TPR) repeat protein